MSLRALALLLVLLLALVVVVLWVDRPPPGQGDEIETLGSLLPAEEAKLQALELQGEGREIRLERRDGSWRLTQPLEAEADPREVKRLCDALAAVAIERVIEQEDTVDLSTFGLQPAEATLRMFPLEDRESVSLTIGRASPVGSGRYVSVGDGRVLLVGGSVASAAHRDAEAFRERRLLPVDPAEVRLVSIERPAGGLTLQRDGSEWRMTAPADDLADTVSVESLLRSLTDLSAERFLEGREAERAHAALGRPRIVAAVESSAGVRLSVEIAGASDGDTRLARRGTSPEVVAVSASAVEKLERPAEEYRDRQVARISLGDVREVRWSSAGISIRAWRETEGADWSIQHDDGPALPGDAGRIEGFLDRIRWLRAVSFRSAAARAFGSTVALSGSSGELGWIEVGDAREESADGEEQVLLRSSWRPGIVMAVSAESLGELPASLDDLVKPDGESAKADHGASS